MPELLFYIIGSLILLFVGLLISDWFLFKRITETFEHHLNETESIINKNFQKKRWLIETETLIIKCQLFKMGSFDKLILTNPTTWIKNKGAEKIAIENRLHGVKQFLLNNQIEGNTHKQVIRIVILHSQVKQIMKYINENERIIIKRNELVNDCYFTQSVTFHSDLYNVLKNSQFLND